MSTENLNISALRLNEENPRILKEKRFKQLVQSLIDFPEMMRLRPSVVDEEGTVLGGNMRTRAKQHLLGLPEGEKEKRIAAAVAARLYNSEGGAQQYTDELRVLLFSEEVPVVRALGLTPELKQQFIIKDNTSFGEWDFDMLANGDWPDAAVLEGWGLDLPPDWNDDAGAPSDSPAGSLAERFVVPPFSILDTRQGYWQERKNVWKRRIGDHGESRNGTLRKSASGDDPSYYRQKSKAEKKVGRELSPEEFEADHYKRTTGLAAGVSLLDPVLAELVVRWFGLEGGAAFDCFAGDSVFGFVAAASGMSFTGIELRQEQADLNQGRTDSEGLPAHYICDDGRNVGHHLAAESQDLLFSCPPYFDLEVYSDKANDASNQSTYAGFLAILRDALTSAVACLKENRFAVITVGDVREKKSSAYYGFPADITAIMRAAGLHYYNELILVEMAGNAAIRAGQQMKHRKPVKTHQQVLVFYKGDPRAIKSHFPEIEYAAEDLESFADDTPGESE